MTIDETLKQRLVEFQRNEITEHHIYRRLAKVVKGEENRKVLEKISDDEKRHYDLWKQYTQRDVAPRRLRAWWFYFLCRVLGFTFGIKLMEAGEDGAQASYGRLRKAIPEAEAIMRDEHDHEDALIAMLDEERLRYTGSIVLGLNDALVELTGALAGFTLALRDTKLIALTGSITGIAAALSMAASEYLSTKAEETEQHPLKASVYTGVAYVFTVLVLIAPYLILTNYYVCLACSLTAAVLIIALFNYYISVAKGVSFRSRFLEMAGLSLSVAALSFFIGYALRAFLGVEV